MLSKIQRNEATRIHNYSYFYNSERRYRLEGKYRKPIQNIIILVEYSMLSVGLGH